MKNKDVTKRLANALGEAPIDLLEQIKSQPIKKMVDHDYITRQEPVQQRSSYWKPLVSVASFIGIFLIGFLGWFTQFRAIDSLVYLDINPSIEIATNKQDHVIHLQGLNEEGRALIKDIEFEGKDVYAVTQDLLDSLLEKGTIDIEHYTMLVSVLNNNQEKSQKQVSQLNEMIHSYFREHQLKPIVLRQAITSTNTLEQFADQYNISLGKMTFIKNLIILNPEFKLEELVNLSIDDLIQLSRKKGLNLKKIIDIDDEDLRGLDDDEKTDLLSTDEAKKIASDLVKGKIVELELDEDDGRYIYEIEIKGRGLEYKIELDARTGEVIKFETDDD